MARRTLMPSVTPLFLSRAIAVFVLLLATAAPANDARSVRFHHHSQDEGLSQSFVYAIGQDRQGFLWFGTQEGLNRFDGYAFKTFSHDPADPLTIADESVRAILKDRSGTLWIGTDAGGLARYNDDGRSFTNFLHDPNDPLSLADNRVRVIYEDRNGNLWIGTDGSGLERFDRATGRFTHFPHDTGNPESLAGAHVNSIAELADGTLWVGTDAGLSRLDPGQLSFVNFRHDPDDASSLSDNNVRALLAGQDGMLWIGTEAGGLNRFDPDTQSFERFTHDPDDPTSISADRINTLFTDDAGTLWIGTVRGLNAWDAEQESFDAYFHNPADRFSLSHDTVFSMFQDRGDVIWIGTYDGICQWNTTAQNVLHYRHNPDDPASLSANTVTSFAEDAAGDVWVGTFGGGLNRLDHERGDFVIYRHDPDDERSISSDRVMALTVDRNGTLWAGTRAAGLNRLDPGEDRFTRYRHDPDDNTSLSADGVTDLLETADGSLWVATFGGGINHLDPVTGAATRFEHDGDDASTLSSDRVLLLYQTRDGALWAGTYGGGLNRMDIETGRFTRYAAMPEQADGFSGDEIYMLREDAAGDLWIGVKGVGLYRWRSTDRAADNPRFERFTERDGLSSSTIYGGEWDQSGRLWMSSNRGITRLNPATGEFTKLGIRHGLQWLEFNLNATLQASDGRLLFGGMNGFNVLDPHTSVQDRAGPAVALTQVRVLNQAIDAGGTVASGPALELGHRDNLIGFEFSALDFAAPENNRFRYRLDGVDPTWVEPGSNRQVNYTNLSPGDYTFRVLAANNEGTWSEQAASFSFLVKPAPWATGWAYAAYLTTMALITMIVTANWRARRARKRRFVQKLRATEARLREAQRIGNTGNWEWEPGSKKAWWSEQAYRLFRMTPQTFDGSRDAYLALVHPDDVDTVTKHVRKAFCEGQSFSTDHRIVLEDGEVRFVNALGKVITDDAGKVLRIAGTISDITERKQTEEEMRHRAEFQGLLADLSSDMIYAQPDEIDQYVPRCLERICCHFELQRAVIHWYDPATEGPTSVYHCSDATASPAAAIPFERCNWISRQLLNGVPFTMSGLGDLPEGAAEDARLLAAHGLTNLLACPLMIEGRFNGTMYFVRAGDDNEWPSRLCNELKLVGEYLAGAIARSRAVAEIKRLRDELKQENLELRQEVRQAHDFAEIIGEDPALRSCLVAVEKVAATSVPVLILGETGTGKDLIARSIHQRSDRSDAPMLTVNCPNLPGDLIESELFGHEKGAFTGAHSRRKGRFELADGGTLFLDEIGDLPLELQAKLLHVLQTGRFERLGGTRTLQTDVRVIAATNHKLKRAVDSGSFRADLYYRIATFPIRLPPLRERKGDIALLAEHFAKKHAARLGRQVEAISAKMLKDLEAWSWPGNVRELEGIIERAIIFSEGSAVLSLPGPLQLITTMHQSADEFERSSESDLKTVERNHVIRILEQVNWQIGGAEGAAALLGIPPSTLRSKMKRLGIVSRQDHLMR